MIQVRVGAPVERVWSALRERDELRRWHGWDYPELDAEIEQVYFSEATVDEAARTVDTGGTVIRVTPAGTDPAGVPGAVLPGAAVPGVAVAAAVAGVDRPGSTVAFDMVAPREDPVWHGWYDDVREGWITFAQQLRFAVERHPGQDRVSAYVEGEQEIPDLPDGRYEWRGLTGEVWFRSERQLGLTVDRWGDGLLVLQPRAAVLTGYGTTPVWEAA